MSDAAEAEARRLLAALEATEDPGARERLSVLLVELGRTEEAMVQLHRVIDRLPESPKGWKPILNAIRAIREPEAKADAWRAWLDFWLRLRNQGAPQAREIGATLAIRLFASLVEMFQLQEPANPSSIDGAWRLARRLYGDPAFGELAHDYPEAFTDFVRGAGEDRYLKAAEKRGSDLGPGIYDALALYAPAARRDELLAVCHADMLAYGGSSETWRQAERLLVDPEFHRPVIICGFHHSGTRLLARQLEVAGIRQRINQYQYEWNYVIQLNTILEPGCMDGRLGAGGDYPGLLSPQRLAFRMALAGLEPGQTWGFKDPRNGLTAKAWLKAFPRARMVNLMRDPVATLGTLPAIYDQFAPAGADATRARFWVDLWEGYVRRTRQAMAKAEASIEVRFEDLCANPPRVLDRIGASLGLAALVNPERLAEIPVEAGKADLREQVRQQLSQEVLEALEALGRRYGYA